MPPEVAQGSRFPIAYPEVHQLRAREHRYFRQSLEGGRRQRGTASTICLRLRLPSIIASSTKDERLKGGQAAAGNRFYDLPTFTIAKHHRQQCQGRRAQSDPCCPHCEARFAMKEGQSIPSLLRPLRRPEALSEVVQEAVEEAVQEE